MVQGQGQVGQRWDWEGHRQERDWAGRDRGGVGRYRGMAKRAVLERLYTDTDNSLGKCL